MKVAALSRFQTDKEAKAVLEGLRDGTVDVVIGTHRLLSAETQVQGPRAWSSSTRSSASASSTRSS